MACGAPVVTSNVAAMPGVAGDAALLVDPTSVDQITQAIKTIVGNSAMRTMLRAKGLARAQRFSWSRTTDKVHELLGLHSN